MTENDVNDTISCEYYNSGHFIEYINVVFAHGDHGSESHTMTLRLFQIPVK